MLNRLVQLATRASLLVILLLFVSLPGLAQSWVPQESGINAWFSCVQFVDDQTGWVSGANGKILRTSNGGASWDELNSGTGYHFSDHYFVDETTGWLVGQLGTIKKTTDGGDTWTWQNSGTTSHLNLVQFADGQTGWAAGEDGTVLKTTDGGDTWIQQQIGFAGGIAGGDFVNAQLGMLACEGGNVLKSTDGGVSWSLQNIASQGLNGADYVSESIAWVVGNGGKILKTANSGADWVEQASGTTEDLNEISFANSDTGWVVGNNGVILVTTNGGTTWQSQPSLTTENLRSVFFISPLHGWAVGLNNVILEYALGNSLPIQLARFAATAVNTNEVRLDWATVSEINNLGFRVQRSNNSSSGFTTLPESFVSGSGTTNAPHEYTFTDNSVSAGRWFYRLEQVDLDGALNYTDPVSVDILTGVDETRLPTVFVLKQNYPNPFNPSTKIEFNIANAGFVSLKVFDVTGREVATVVNEVMPQGSYLKEFSGAGLSSGVYLYKLTAGNFVSTKKFVLAK